MPLSIDANVPLAPRTTLELGGRARWLAHAVWAVDGVDGPLRNEDDGVWTVDGTMTQAALAGSGITCPPLDDALLRLYLDALLDTRPDARDPG